MKIVTLLLTMLISTTCYARIGETKAECIKRYGKVTKSNPKGHPMFKSNGLSISTVFGDDGKCAAIYYHDDDNKKILSGAAIKTLLAANVGEQEWDEETTNALAVLVNPKTVGLKGTLESKKNGWIVYFEARPDQNKECMMEMIITSKEFIKRAEKKEQKKQVEKVKGL